VLTDNLLGATSIAELFLKNIGKIGRGLDLIRGALPPFSPLLATGLYITFDDVLNLKLC